MGSDSLKEIVLIPAESFTADLKAGLVLNASYDVEADMTHSGHIGRTVISPQAHQVIVKDDIRNPVQTIFDTPM